MMESLSIVGYLIIGFLFGILVNCRGWLDTNPYDPTTFWCSIIISMLGWPLMLLLNLFLLIFDYLVFIYSKMEKRFKIPSLRKAVIKCHEKHGKKKSVTSLTSIHP